MFSICFFCSEGTLSRRKRQYADMIFNEHLGDNWFKAHSKGCRTIGCGISIGDMYVLFTFFTTAARLQSLFIQSVLCKFYSALIDCLDK